MPLFFCIFLVLILLHLHDRKSEWWARHVCDVSLCTVHVCVCTRMHVGFFLRGHVAVYACFMWCIVCMYVLRRHSRWWREHMRSGPIRGATRCKKSDWPKNKIQIDCALAGPLKVGSTISSLPPPRWPERWNPHRPRSFGHRRRRRISPSHPLHGRFVTSIGSASPSSSPASRHGMLSSLLDATAHARSPCLSTLGVS